MLGEGMSVSLELTSGTGFNGWIDLEHTADIQIHSWGNTVIESFTQCSYALYDYMTNRESVKEDKDYTTIVIVEGDSVEGLLYNFLDELLFRFSSEPFFVAKRIVINSLDLNNYQLSATW